jgi:hypothetical protein
MSSRSIVLLLALPFLGSISIAATPTTRLYPFPGVDLQDIRAISRGEFIAPSLELKEAWLAYGEVRGAWMPGAPKPTAAATSILDQLKSKLEGLPEPAWFAAAMQAPQTKPSQLAEKIGDPIFESQKDNPEFQVLKARAIIYMAEFELDRPGAAANAGRFLSILETAHPWDWELQSLYARLLADVGRTGPALHAAALGLFLNPVPRLGDLKFFAYVGARTARELWPEIQAALRQSGADATVVEQAIAESASLYTGNPGQAAGALKRQ